MDSRLRRTRLSIAAIFFVNGAVFTNWVPRIPEVKATLGLSEGELGLALLGVAAGAFVTMPLCGLLVNRVGSRAMVRAAVLTYCAVLPLPALATNLPSLTVALAALGGGVGALDVTMNAYGVSLERYAERPLLSSLHGFFSVGYLAGAACGGAAAGAGISPAPHLAAVAVVLGALAAVACSMLIYTGDRREDTGSSRAGKPSMRSRLLGFPPALFVLAAIAFGAALVEGAVADWSGVYLAESLDSAPGLSAAGFIAFSAAMAASRFAGDPLRRRFGDRRLISCGGVLAALAMAAGLMAGNLATAVIAFGLVGVGIALVFPIVLGAADSLPQISGASGVAFVSTVGYFAFLVGPPLIGLIATRRTLAEALGVAVVVSLIVAVLPYTSRLRKAEVLSRWKKASSR